MIRLSITSGRGPAECRIALAKALDVMAAEAEAAGLSCDIAKGPAPDAHGPSSAVAVIAGVGADAFARHWIGSVLWVTQSPVRPHHRRKNWFIGIVMLPDRDCGAATDFVQEADFRFETFRAGGAGGQHQNKTESAVRAVHAPSGTSVVAREERSQHRNKAVAVRRLRALLAAREELIREAEKSLRQAQHDCLERGRPVRRFVGAAFKESAKEG